MDQVDQVDLRLGLLPLVCQRHSLVDEKGIFRVLFLTLLASPSLPAPVGNILGPHTAANLIDHEQLHIDYEARKRS